MIDLLKSSPWMMVGVGYSVGFWAVLFWIVADAWQQKREIRLMRALGYALIFPVGVFIYKGPQGWD